MRLFSLYREKLRFCSGVFQKKLKKFQKFLFCRRNTLKNNTWSGVFYTCNFTIKIKRIYSTVILLFYFLFTRLFNLHHSVTNADMRLDILGRICVLFKLFAERRHKNTQGSNIIIPTAAPNVLGNKGMG